MGPSTFSEIDKGPASPLLILTQRPKLIVFHQTMDRKNFARSECHHGMKEGKQGKGSS